VNLLFRQHWGIAVGIKSVLGIAFFLTGISSATFAQTLSHPLSSRRGDFFFEAKALPDTVRVLAIMVQFQQDNDSRTTGGGQLEVFTGNPDSVIDAPPHDRSYFQNHLAFLQNYYAKVSDGKLIVRADVLDQVITLSNQMQAYSLQSDGDNGPLAALVQDSWRKADSLMPSTEFSRYQSFVIFHAGVGHDVNVADIIGYDPTPFDIPSLYLGLPALKTIFGSDYQGVPVNSGRAFITNSMLIPESENRVLETSTGPTLIELSINGLLAASFGSFLGLPDLFDTQTGRSGIGRFGLMDGQAIFSFNGLFPPEPSAWEKIYLGWVTPITVPPGTSSLTARAVGFHDGQPSAIYKIPINAREYFLVENRNRDPGQNGQRVKTVINGQVVEKFFLHDTTGFDLDDISGTHAIRGVVIDVEDYDWSLPGGTDHQRGIFYDGGILIWHIDENVIEANYATNTVNADPEHRGVDLEEADGSQDLGVVYDDGTALDFWYKGNASPVNKNAFTPTTNPNSLSYSLTDSHIYMTDFSVRGPTMTFNAQLGDDAVRPLMGFPKFVGGTGMVGSPIAQRAGCPAVCNNFFVASGGNLYGFRLNGTSLTADSTGFFVAGGAAYQPALPYLCTPIVPLDIPGDLVSVSDSTVSVWFAKDADGDGKADLQSARSIGHHITTPPVLLMDGTRLSIGVGDEDGGVSIVTKDSLKRYVVSSQHPVEALLNVNGSWIAVAEDRAATLNGKTWDLGGETAVQAASGDIDGDGTPEIVVLTEDNRLLVLSLTSTDVRSLSASLPVGNPSPMAVGDVDGDGRKDIVFSIGSDIYALNSSGNPIDHFPIKMPSDAGSASGVVMARLGADKGLTLFVGTSTGLVFGFDPSGRVLSGFPLSVDGSIAGSLALFEEPDYLGLLAATTNGYLYAWSLTQSSEVIIWRNTFGDPFHSGFEGSASTAQPISTEFFPADRAYNWPNPVYGSSTQIRYFLKTNADVNVKILDLAGDKVAEFAGPGVGGIDNEVSWDVSNVQSGVYIARIEANGFGEHGVAFVKIAVVK
jgi:hypothetical protein